MGYPIDDGGVVAGLVARDPADSGHAPLQENLERLERDGREPRP